MPSSLLPRLIWAPHPENPRSMLATSRAMPGVTLFVIELCDDRDDRGIMMGAFVPDELEHTLVFSRAKIPWLKGQAEMLLHNFLEAHVANDSDVPEWAAKAAEEIDITLGEVVRKNTNLKFGFFAGISINDIARIITRHCPNTELIEENRHLKDQLATLSKTHAKDRQRLDELLSDYIRDKRIIGESLGLTGEDAMIHSFQLREIRSLQNVKGDSTTSAP
jgi:hypothetical protein